MSKSALEAEFATQLAEHNINGWVREHRFIPDRRFRFDFAFLGPMIAVEIEGGTWARGRHNRGSGFASDCWKYNLANKHAWTVLRFTGDMVKSGEALDFLKSVLSPAPAIGTVS